MNTPVNAAIAQARDLEATLEALADRHGLRAVVEALGQVCSDKADHIAENWADMALAKTWDREARVLLRAAREVRV